MWPTRRSKIICVKYCDIPDYLHDSEYYRSLDAEDEEEVDVPKKYFKEDDKVDDFDDMVNLLYVHKFWSLASVPKSVLRFCYELDVSVWEDVMPASELLELQDLSDIFSSEMPLLAAIEAANNDVTYFLIPLRESVVKYHQVACDCAAISGNLECLKLLHRHGYNWDEDTCEAAVRNGRLDCLKYVHENGCPWDKELMAECAKLGHLACLQYLHQQGMGWSADVTDDAAEAGQLSCLRYAHENGCPWDERVVVKASQGHHECLAYALQHDCPLFDRAHTIAAAGYLDCLKVLHDHNHDFWDPDATHRAASGGYLDCLQYLHEQGCPWDHAATSSAAGTGALECLRFAAEHGCEVIHEALHRAVSGRHLDCVKYLLEERGLQLEEDGATFAIALVTAQYDCLEFLLSRNCPLGILQDNTHHHPSVHYEHLRDMDRDKEELDAETARCVELAHRSGWRWDDLFVRFVKNNRSEYPICCAFMSL